MLNPFLITLPEKAGIYPGLFDKITGAGRLGKWIFKTYMNVTGKLAPTIKTRHEEAFERLLRMTKNLLRTEKFHSERYKELKKVKRNSLFVKGLATFDKDFFFKEFIYGKTPIDHLHLIRQYYPQALETVYRIPKFFTYSEGDTVIKLNEKSELYVKTYPQEFGNAEVIHMSGLTHAVTYPGKKLKLGRPFDTAYLNYLHYYLKYHL
ncbi:hypothetical protein CMO93_03930 [Candidatus Woesearchaeota archaeon]|nr:hypothetical protein [Candidatus Woesearchaeota archaeon]